MLCALLVNLPASKKAASLDESDDSSDDQSAVETDDNDSADLLDVKRASKHRLAAKADQAREGKERKKLKPLTPAQRKKVQGRIKKLKAQILKEEKKATADDQQVKDKATELRTELLHAKTLRRAGDDFESEARSVRVQFFFSSGFALTYFKTASKKGRERPQTR